MTGERTDHVALAVDLLDEVGWQAADDDQKLIGALVHATLAVAEQQRIANALQVALVDQLTAIAPYLAETGATAPVKRATRKVQRAPIEATRESEIEPDGADPAKAIEAPQEPAEGSSGESVPDPVVVDEQLAAESRAAAAREFQDRPVMDEPMVDWAPPTDADAPPEEPI